MKWSVKVVCGMIVDWAGMWHDTHPPEGETGQGVRAMSPARLRGWVPSSSACGGEFGPPGV
jgi:hypothetical protein